jgi:Nucleotidyl transferase AbiEii toxin, Type IV TA system
MSRSGKRGRSAIATGDQLPVSKRSGSFEPGSSGCIRRGRQRNHGSAISLIMSSKPKSSVESPMASPDVEVYRALSQALSFLGVSWYVFGAQAAILHGATRFTEDLDVTVLLGTKEPRALVNELAHHGFSLRVKDVDAFVEKTRVLPVLHTETGIPVDVVLGGPGLEELFAQRARPMDVGGVSVPVVTAEDLIAMKILAGRPKDIEDVVAILTVQASHLDLRQVRETVATVEQALDQSDLSPLLEQCVRRASAS